MRSATVARIAAETYPGPPTSSEPAPGPGTRRQALTTNPAGDATVWAKVATELLFQPGGTEAELVFTDFATLCTYAQTLPQKTIRFDYSLVANTFTIPAGAYDFGPNATWVGNGDFQDITFVDIADGATFATVPIAFEGFIEVFGEGAAPWTLTANMLTSVGPHAALDGGLVALFDLQGVTLIVNLAGTIGDGGDPVFVGSAGGRAFITASAGAQLRDAISDGTATLTVTIQGEGVTIHSNVFALATVHYSAGLVVVGTGTPNLAHVAEVAGVFFWSTDQRAMYVTNGSVWQIVPEFAFVFSPSGTDAPGVFTSFATLCTVVALMPGSKIIYFDLSHVADAFAFPAGAFNHGPNVEWRALVRTGNGSVPVLTFSAGTQITTCPTVIENLSLTVSQVGTEVIPTPTGNATRLEYRGAQGDAVVRPQMQSSSSPFVGITTGSDFVLVLRGTADIINGGAPAIFDHGIATNITVRVFDEATIAASAISFQGADRPIIHIDSPAVHVDFSYAQFCVLNPGCPWAAAGAPENNVPGTVGCLYCNTGGGAGTTFFVKESGSAKTGWIGK